MKRFGLIPKLLLGIIVGICIGVIAKATQFYVLVRLLATFSGLFGNFLKYIVPFIILAFVIPGIADLGKKAGKLLGVTTIIAYFSSLGAGFLAFGVGSMVLPGIIHAGNAVNPGQGLQAPYFEIAIDPAMGVMTALVTAFLVGLGLAFTNKKGLLEVVRDFQGIVELSVKKVIIPFLPLHIAGTFANMAATGKIAQMMITFGELFALIILLQLCYILIQYTIAGLYTKRNPFPALKNMLPAYLTAIGTQSSAATIPVTMRSVRNNQVKEDVVDFVVPLCATIHLAGDVIALTLASMAVMLMSGTTPTSAMMMPFIFMLGIMMVAAPGIPGGGVMASLGLLKDMLGFNPVQTTIMIALHLTQDSFGTATNVTGDGAIALAINKQAQKVE